MSRVVLAPRLMPQANRESGTLLNLVVEDTPYHVALREALKPIRRMQLARRGAHPGERRLVIELVGDMPSWQIDAVEEAKTASNF